MRQTSLHPLIPQKPLPGIVLGRAAHPQRRLDRRDLGLLHQASRKELDDLSGLMDSKGQDERLAECVSAAWPSASLLLRIVRSVREKGQDSKKWKNPKAKEVAQTTVHTHMLQKNTKIKQILKKKIFWEDVVWVAKYKEIKHSKSFSVAWGD